MSRRSGTMPFIVLCFLPAFAVSAEESSNWKPLPADWKGAAFQDGRAEMSAEKWSFLLAAEEMTDGAVSATVTIAEPAKRSEFFGGGWSAWPDPTFNDGGFDAGLLVRG